MVSVLYYMLVKTLLIFSFLFAFALSALVVPLFVIESVAWSAFVPLLLLYAAYSFAWESIADAVAALLDDPIFGMLANVSLWCLAILFSGFLVPPKDLYWPLKALHYIFPWGYWTRSSCYDVTFSETAWIPCTDPTSSAVCMNSTNGMDVLDSFSRVFPLVTSENRYSEDLGTLVGKGLF
jgi:hypothetical protein